VFYDILLIGKKIIEWRKIETNVADIVDNFKEGLNKIDYDKYRWTGTYAIYYPNWEKTNELLNNILNSKKKYCHLDIFLSKNKLIDYLYFPSPFMSCDEGKSQIRRELRKNILELQKIKENSNEEISALIEIHFEELAKLDRSLKDFIFK
jgi:hypothetical protein